MALLQVLLHGRLKVGRGTAGREALSQVQAFLPVQWKIIDGSTRGNKVSSNVYLPAVPADCTHSTTHCRKQREVPEAEQTLSPQFVSHVSRLAFLFHLEFWSQVRMFLWAKLIQLSYGTYPLCRICEKPSPIILFA